MMHMLVRGLCIGWERIGMAHAMSTIKIEDFGKWRRCREAISSTSGDMQVDVVVANATVSLVCV